MKLAWVCLLLASCYPLSPQRRHAEALAFDAEVFSMSVEEGLKKLRKRTLVEKVSPGVFRVTWLSFTGEPDKESCLVSVHERDGGRSSAYHLEEPSPTWCPGRLWPTLDAAGYEEGRAAVDARAKPEYDQSVRDASDRELREIAAEAAWVPRWAFTGGVGVSVQTDLQLGVGARAGLRRWSAPHLGWSIDLSYDLVSRISPALARHQLSIAPHLDLLWKPLRPGSTLPAASLSLFAAPVLSISGSGVGFGWRAGVRASWIASDWFLTVPHSFTVSFEEDRIHGPTPIVLRAVRFSIGFGL